MHYLQMLGVLLVISNFLVLRVQYARHHQPMAQKNWAAIWSAR